MLQIFVVGAVAYQPGPIIGRPAPALSASSRFIARRAGQRAYPEVQMQDKPSGLDDAIEAASSALESAMSVFGLSEKSVEKKNEDTASVADAVKRQNLEDLLAGQAADLLGILR